MKKFSFIFLLVTVVCILSGCGKQTEFSISISIPAGSEEPFVYSHEEISPLKSEITLSNGEDLEDTQVVLEPIEVKQENAYEPEALIKGKPVKMKVEKKAWFRVGVAVQNPTQEEITVHVNIKDVELRIE